MTKQKRNKRVTVMFTADELAALKEGAKYTGSSDSSYVRLMYFYGRHATASTQASLENLYAMWNASKEGEYVQQEKEGEEN